MTDLVDGIPHVDEADAQLRRPKVGALVRSPRRATQATSAVAAPVMHAYSRLVEVLSRRRVWPRLTQLAKAASDGQRSAAVAYVGAGAYDLLPFGPGDVLVADCTPASAAASATNPSEIRRFLDAGVSVYRWQGLHAKAYVLGDVAVVGSPNASRHSAVDLDEVAVVLKTKGAVRQVRALIDSLKVATVDEDWLDLCEAKWRAPRFVPRRQQMEAWFPIPDGDQWRLWAIQSESVVDWPQSVADAIQQHDAGVRSHAPGPYRLETLTWDGRPRLRTGDVVIERWTDDYGYVKVWPPSLVEQVWTVTRGRNRWTLVTLMRPRGIRPVAESTVATAATRAGLRLRDASEQHFRDVTAARALLEDLWPTVLPSSEGSTAAHMRPESRRG